jgi:hypothetical protein
MYVNSGCNFRKQNVIEKEAERILNYKNLTREIQHMWNVNTKVIPVMIRANGTKDHSENT